MDRTQFADLLKSALTHLYDHAYLQLHPLTRALQRAAGQQNHGVTLHRILLESLEQMRPGARIPISDPAWRPYLVLHMRYVDGCEIEQIAEELALSQRQLRREQAKGLEALIDLVWLTWGKQLGSERPSPSSPFSPLSHEASAVDIVQTEALRLSTSSDPGHDAGVEEVMQSIQATLAKLITQNAATLAIDLPRGLPPVAMKRMILRQILLTVLTYLVESAPGGHVQIHASTEAQQLTLWLHSERHAPGGATGVAPGSLLPLTPERFAMAEQLALMNGGSLFVQVDGSIRVALHLPLRHAPTVLIVDDNPDVIQLFRRYLAGSHYSVLDATGYQAAWEVVQRHELWAILLDVMMDDRDGWELLQRLKAQPQTAAIPVIICSVLNERSLALSLGAADFLPKPVSQQMLLAALATHATALLRTRAADADDPD